jgi:hypothetical protein
MENWVLRLLYGGGAMDDLKLPSPRGIRRLVGWATIPDPTTIGRWCAPPATPVGVLDRLL